MMEICCFKISICAAYPLTFMSQSEEMSERRGVYTPDKSIKENGKLLQMQEQGFDIPFSN
ncbi:hypothetical protein JOB18_039082 [Solea senegalensis]|uniref:Uncharacterized protein n=1 Tax=Solea senegalensis TaxID=28829 RepID=A0AAV6R4P4_SOLSE|nr:hypothetical protein JOB18_039082 [Solea senegalensis]